MPGERDYRHCLDHIIKNCSAPCIGRIAQADYLRRVEEACEFLEGASRQMIEQVETEMRAAAEKLDFEKAAELRNLLDDLKRTTKPMTRFTRKALPTPSTRRKICAPWRMPFSSVALRESWNASTFPTFPAPTSWPAWCDLRMECRIAQTIAATEFEEHPTRTISPAWPRWSDGVTRGCLREAHLEKDPVEKRDVGDDRLLAGVQPGITCADPAASCHAR